MTRIESISKFTFGYIMFFLLLACNTNVKQNEESVKIADDPRTDNLNIPSPEKTNSGSGIDTIVITGMQFQPAELHIKKGDTVVWINKDIVTHDATEFPDREWTSGPLINGSSWKMAVNKSYDYFCSIHITMKGKLIVEP